MTVSHCYNECAISDSIIVVSHNADVCPAVAAQRKCKYALRRVIDGAWKHVIVFRKRRWPEILPLMFHFNDRLLDLMGLFGHKRISSCAMSSTLVIMTSTLTSEVDPCMGFKFWSWTNIIKIDQFRSTLTRYTMTVGTNSTALCPLKDKQVFTRTLLPKTTFWPWPYTYIAHIIDITSNLMKHN